VFAAFAGFSDIDSLTELAGKIVDVVDEVVVLVPTVVVEDVVDVDVEVEVLLMEVVVA
jgi:hypothetical protein